MIKPGLSRLPAEEEAICQRVREARIGLQMTQTQFAKRVKINRVRLASYEYARAPIRWGLGDRICRAFMISHRWLAEGSGPKHSLFRPPHQPDAKGLFSAGYASLSGEVSSALSAAAADYGCPVEVLEKAGITAPPANEAERREGQQTLLPALIAHELQFVSGPRVDEYFKAIQKASERFTAEVKAVVPQPARKSKATKVKK